MDKTETLLLKETRKWLQKLEKKNIQSPSSKGEVHQHILNIQAYTSDCKHFLEKKDFIRAFEAIIYAWGIFETLERMGLLKK